MAVSIATMWVGVGISAAESPWWHGQQQEIGKTLRYVLDGRNQDGAQTTAYQVRADGAVQKDRAGMLVHEFGWSQLSFNGTALPLSDASLSVRQELSTDPAFRLSLPPLGKVQPALIGPMLDLLTFYVDVQLARRQDALRRPGDHVYVKHGTPNSWADHVRFSLGEDSIDFDVMLLALDPKTKAATLVVKHVPPATPQIRLPADWMKAPVSDTPNNWVQVKNAGGGKYVASVGKELFTDEIQLSPNGTIVSATMENPVDVQERDCSNAALTNCGPTRRYEILRHIELRMRQ
jgi:hypothetical protein